MTSTLSGPELTEVPVGAVELSDAPTVPGAGAPAAASRALTLSVAAFFRDWVRALISSSASRREAISGISCLLSQAASVAQTYRSPYQSEDYPGKHYFSHREKLVQTFR